MPGHELVDAVLRPAIDEPGQQVGQVDLRIDAIEFAGFHERGDVGPAAAAVIPRRE